MTDSRWVTCSSLLSLLLSEAVETSSKPHRHSSYYRLGLESHYLYVRNVSCINTKFHTRHLIPENAYARVITKVEAE